MPPDPHPPEEKDTRRIRLWDLPLRLFHWLLALLVLFAWLSAENGEMDVHQRVGSLIIGLLIFRLAWGIWGSRNARFRNFVRRPAKVLAWLRAGSPAPRSHGHNPLGGYSVILMLGVLGIQAFLGLFSNDDILFRAPLADVADAASDGLSDTLTSVHHALFHYAVLPVIVLHIAAVLFYLVVKGDNLIRPMITGKKDVPVGDDRPEPVLAGAVPALPLAGVVLALSFWLLGS